MKNHLTFDEEKHLYFLNGVELPSVTRVLKPLSDFDRIDKDILKRAQDFGTAVHKTCELYDLDDLDEGNLDPALAPYLEGWKSFRRECSFLPMHIEERVYSEKHMFAGTLDRIGVMRGADALVDIKSGTSLYPSVGPQLAGYEIAARALGLIGKKPIVRYAVQLMKNGRYKLESYTSQSDSTVFLACLTLHQFRSQHGN